MRIDSLLVVERAKEEERVVIVLQQNTNLPIIMRWGLVRFQSKLIIYYEYLKVNILHTTSSIKIGRTEHPQKEG